MLELLDHVTSSDDSGDDASKRVAVHLTSYGQCNEGERYTRLYLHVQPQQSDLGRPQPAATLSAVLSFTQLLRLVDVPIELVPPALLQRVRFSQSRVELVVDAATGTALYVVGSARCTSGDYLSIFNRLAPCVEQHISPFSLTDAVSIHMSELTRSQLNRCLLLRDRAVLDPAVFPRLATLTHNHCLEPEYMYVLCETEGSVELAQDERELFNSLLYPVRMGGIHPLRLRPTNAVCALSPHLPSGCLELPASALAIVATGSTLVDSRATVTVATSSQSSFANIQRCSVEMLLLCASYLDTNSLLFGLLPALHSLPAVTTALMTSMNGRCILLSRFGASSDAALWSEQLLDKWRRVGFKQQRASVKPSWSAWDDSKKLKERTVKACEQVDREEQRALRLEVHWAAIVDLQTRVNKYLIRVMLQRRELVLPQLYLPSLPLPPPLASPPPAPPGTVRPVYTTVPDLVLQLLLCVPPFRALPTQAGQHGELAVDNQLKRFVGDTPQQHANFAAILRIPNCAAYDENDEPTDSDHTAKALYMLCMGPVYAYENDYTAGKGVAVAMAELRELSIEDNRDAGEQQPRPLIPLIPHDANRQRAVRQLFIEDVNQLPVLAIRWYDRGLDNYPPYVAETLRSCFKRERVLDLIAETRAKWRRRATKYRQSAARQQVEDRVAEEGTGESDEEEDAADGGEDREDADAGAKLEYVEPLMDALLKQLCSALQTEEEWMREEE